MSINFPRSGFLFILSSPSGAGKTTLSKLLLKRNKNIHLSISVTTRQPRKDERDGVDYHFISEEQFKAWQEEGLFLEWAQVFDHLYGTLRQNVEEQMEAGQDVLFDIDWQGAASLKRLLPDKTVTVFILPPSLQQLRQRLQDRGDPPHLIESRMEKACDEISHAPGYDYIIVNEHLEDSLKTLENILNTERLRRSRFIDFEAQIKKNWKQPDL